MTEHETFTLTDPETVECPYKAYAKAHREFPVFKDSATGFYNITRYADLLEMIRNVSVFTSDYDYNHAAVGTDDVYEEIREIYRTKGWLRANTIESDPPKHTHIRQAVSPSFTASRIRALVPRMFEIANELIDDFIDKGEVDFVDAFSHPYPMTVMAGLLGVDKKDLHQFRIWSQAGIDVFGVLVDRKRRIEATHLDVEMQHYLFACLEDRKENPKEDLLTDLAQSDLTLEQKLSFARILLIAGNETTTDALSSTLLLLLRHPEAMAQLRADPSLIQSAIEESLRLESPVLGSWRMTKTDIDVSGTVIPKGAIVTPRFGAANRDEAQFPEADTFDIGRKNAGSHLAFGAGIHHCLGAQLARQELYVGFEVILKRLKNIQLATGKNDFKHRPSSMLRHLNELHITFEDASV